MVFMGNGAVVDGFGATISNVRSFVKTATPFPDIISTGLVTGGTGGTLDVAENDLATSICFLTVIPMNTKVMSIIKGAFVVPVTQPVKFNFLGDGSRILA